MSNLHCLTPLKDIPAIVVDTMPSTPPPTTRDITSARSDSTGRIPEYASPSPMNQYSPDLALSNSNGASLQRSRRISDMSMLSTDLGNRYMFVHFISDYASTLTILLADEIARH